MRFAGTQWSIGGLLCGVALVLAACSMEARPALRVGTIIWPGFEPLYVAHARGSLAEPRFRLMDFSSAVEVTRAYRNGVLDVAAMTADEALSIAAMQPGKHRIFVVADYSSGADVIIAQPEIREMSQLKGMRIGVESDALGAYILLRSLQLRGMTPADVQIVTLAHEQQVAAFRSRKVDAIVTFEPNRTRLLAMAGHEIFSSREIPSEVADVLVARQEVLDSRHDDLVVLARAWFASVEALRRGDAEAISLAAAHEAVGAEQFKVSLAEIELIDRNRNLELLGAGPMSFAVLLKRLSQTMVDSKLLPRNVTPESLLDSSVVERALP